MKRNALKLLSITIVLAVLLTLTGCSGKNQPESQPVSTSSELVMSTGSTADSVSAGADEEIMAEELDELEEEEPLVGEDGEEVPSVDVSDEAVIEIGETEAAGSL